MVQVKVIMQVKVMMQELTDLLLHPPDEPGLLGVAAAQHQHEVAGVAVDPDQAQQQLLQPQTLSNSCDSFRTAW